MAPREIVPVAVPDEVIEELELHAGIEQGVLKAAYVSNGREKLRADITNTGKATLKIQAEAGQMLESGKNAIVVIRSTSIEIAAGDRGDLLLQTVAAHSSNKLGDAAYTLTYNKMPRLDPLLEHVKSHPELSMAAIQTAALALIENLPLSAVAKFTPAGEFKSQFDTDSFRVDPIDIIAALSALREMGVAEESIAMTIDPQLKIESMIEPLSRAAAMHYYRITAEKEWEFWKEELLNGAPATRHYALYGIARFYPQVAIEMLPKWARETKTSPVFRLAALQALADTQRPEALPILRQLSDELGPQTELGRAALGAAEYLDKRLSRAATHQEPVEFRASKKLKF